MNESKSVAAIETWGLVDQDSWITARDEQCSRERVQRALDELGDYHVISVGLMKSGRYEVPPPPYASRFGLAFPTDVVLVEDLPPFCEVQVDAPGPGGHVARIVVWVPLTWNRRFLGTVGGGNRTDSWLGMPGFLRSMTLPVALRRGFSTAKSDGANRDSRAFDWGLNDDQTLDRDLIENMSHRSTHEMTVVGKAVTRAVHDTPPRYSYLAGCSGGGRQSLMEAQRYPDDYDGIWASDPAINWSKFIPAELWPALVMKERTVLAPAKLEAFRSASVEACDGIDGLRDGIIGAFDPVTFDPKSLVGKLTEAGEITAIDAEVMAAIWEGPRRRTGEPLWYGLAPGTESWGNNFALVGLCQSQEVAGRLVPLPFEIAEATMRCWVVKDMNWDWRTLTLEQYEKLFDQSVKELADMSADDPNLSAFRERSGKLLITHGANDQVIPAMGSVHYYRRVIDTMGSEEKTKEFARLYITEGDGHGANLMMRGPGVFAADAMTSLIKWVEEAVPPDEIIAKCLDFTTNAVLATRPVYPYPLVPSYRGDGDPSQASSFKPVHYHEREQLAATSNPREEPA